MNWKLTLLLTILAVPGGLVLAWLALPALVDPHDVPIPLRTLQIAVAAQSTLLAAMASAVGALLSPKVGLRAPALLAVVSRGNVVDALRPQLLPSAVGGLVGACILVGFHAISPDALAEAHRRGSIPLLVRVLYGGITEEVLMRWGLMTLFVWVGWRILQHGRGEAAAAVVWLAIGLSAVLFGVSHLPSVTAVMAEVPGAVVAWITVGNALFGMMAGYLFWCFGLEAAVTAHVLAHVIAWAVRG